MKMPTSSTRILVALVAGLFLGIAFSGSTGAWLDGSIAVAEPLGKLWLDALRMTIIPLVFALLITGIAATASTVAAGGLASRSLVFFLCVLLGAALFGQLAVASWLALWPIPQDAASAMRQAMNATDTVVPAAASAADWLGAIMPSNPIRAAADGDMLPLVIFALLFGFAVTRIAEARSRTIVDFFHAVVDAMMVIVHWVILLAPFGVFALAYLVGARAGIGAAGALAHYLLMLVVVQLGLIALIYPFAVLAARLPLLQFARAVAPAQAVAASTQSSLASLPAMVEATRQLQVSPAVSAMVLPLAVSVFRLTSPVANLAVVLYSASLLGVELGPMQYAAGAVIAVIMSFASVGLPGQVSFFTSIVPICVAMGVPVAALPLLLAVETIPDIFRTVGNVTADVAVTAALAEHAGVATPLPEAAPAPGEVG